MINGVQTGMIVADFTSLRGADGEPLGQIGGLENLGSLLQGVSPADMGGPINFPAAASRPNMNISEIERQ